MKKLNVKVIFASLALGAAALLSTTLSAQTAPAPILVGAGSSALFNTLSFTWFETGSVGYALCGANHWTYKTSAVGGTYETSIHDSRSSLIGNEPATIVVAWNGSADGVTTVPTKICAYLQVDSTVGVRSAFARTAAGTPAASAYISTSLAGVAGQNKVPNTTIADVPLPANVLASVSGALITFAGADIRAEDAKFATGRTLAAQGASVNTIPWEGSLLNSMVNAKGLGYANTSDTFSCAGDNTTPIGYPIESSQSSTVANPVDFALFGTDPISCGNAAASYQEYKIGAGPVIVFVNTSNTGMGHLGDSNLTDINTALLAGFLDGTFSRTSDMFTNYAAGSLTPYGVSTFIREPLSGTMNTIEYNVPNTFRYYTTQEKGVTGGPVTALVAGSTMNPLSLSNPNGFGGRYRAVGTGEEVKTVLNNADSLGYAFWGYGNFSGATTASGTAGTSARYLTVNGVDPLYSGPSANPTAPGVFPLKTAGVYPILSFPNIQNGSYPIWTIFRIVAVPEASSAWIKLLVTNMQTNASINSDFIPATSLNIFRSHFYQAGIGGADGNTWDAAASVYYQEQGGDVGGMVYPVQADYDFITDTNANGLYNRHN
jgi:hypothetical protein